MKIGIGPNLVILFIFLHDKQLFVFLVSANIRTRPLGSFYEEKLLCIFYLSIYFYKTLYAASYENRMYIFHQKFAGY